MAQLLADWRIAPEVFMPVKFSLDDYAFVSRLLEPMRTKAELVKVAILLGRIAVGRWESWDLVQFPPASVLDRLRVHEVEQLVQQTRSDVMQLAQFHPSGTPMHKQVAAPQIEGTAAYCNFSGHDTDLVKEFLPALGLEVRCYTTCDLRQFKEPQIANCLGIEATKFAVQRTNKISSIITDAAKCEAFARYAPAIGLPNSFSRVRETILAHVADHVGEPVAGRCDLSPSSRDAGSIAEAPNRSVPGLVSSGHRSKRDFKQRTTRYAICRLRVDCLQRRLAPILQSSVRQSSQSS